MNGLTYCNKSKVVVCFYLHKTCIVGSEVNWCVVQSKARDCRLQTLTFLLLLTQNEASLVLGEQFCVWQCCSSHWFRLVPEVHTKCLQESNCDACLETRFASWSQHGVLKSNGNVCFRRRLHDVFSLKNDVVSYRIGCSSTRIQ